VLRVVLTVLTLAVTIYALIDCIQTPDRTVRNLPKLAWIVLVALVSWVGPIAWFLAGAPTPPWQRGLGGRFGPPSTRGPQAPRGPEDDPDFLRGL